MKTNITTSMLSGIKAAEKQLARNEIKQTLDELPPGHPLNGAINAQEKISGDIADLPDTHPLKIQIREAQTRITAQKEAEKTAIEKKDQVRKARRIADQQRERQDEEEKRQEERKIAVKVINEKINSALESMDNLLGVVGEKRALFAEDFIIQSKMVRLQRMIMASKKSLTDGRMSTVMV